MLSQVPWWLFPLLMCLVLTGIHGYLGIHVLKRKVIFVDLAMAQIAALGAAYAILLGYDPKHPENSFPIYLFSLGFTFVGSLALVLGFGVSADAAILINYAATFMGMFQHANISTPRWLGYVIQRPESHNYHHERGVHARNYGDLPLFDILFGTFHNPEDFAGQVGFFDGGSKKVGPMLIGKVIS